MPVESKVDVEARIYRGYRGGCQRGVKTCQHENVRQRISKNLYMF